MVAARLVVPDPSGDAATRVVGGPRSDAAPSDDAATRQRREPPPSAAGSGDSAPPIPARVAGDPEPAPVAARLRHAVQLPGDRRRHHSRSPDLDVLRDIIELNQLSEDSSLHDHDDGDGAFEPLELGYQVWEAGRLIELHSGPDEYTSYGYELRELPDSVGGLDALVELDLHTNRLRRLPESIRFLGRLRRLRLQRNRLEALPDGLFGLSELRELALSENALRALPESIEALDRLRVLHLRDNPLERLPHRIGRLVRLETLTLQRSDRSGPALAALPDAMRDLRSLRLLNVAGLSLNCVTEPPGFLVDGSIDRVYGLAHQRCPGADPAL